MRLSWWWKKAQLKEEDNKRKKKCDNLDDNKSEQMKNVEMCIMTDPCILTTPAFRLIEEDLKSAI